MCLLSANGALTRVDLLLYRGIVRAVPRDGRILAAHSSKTRLQSSRPTPRWRVCEGGLVLQGLMRTVVGFVGF